LLLGLVGIVALQIFSFGADLLLVKTLPPAQINPLIRQTMRRIGLLYAAVFIGFMLALFMRIDYFALPFIGLKTRSGCGDADQRTPARRATLGKTWQVALSRDLTSQDFAYAGRASVLYPATVTYAAPALVHYGPTRLVLPDSRVASILFILRKSIAKRAHLRDK